MVAACRFQSFCDICDLNLSNLNMLSDSFSSVCTPCKTFTSFMCVRKKLKQVWDSCIQLVVICHHSLFTSSILNLLTHSFSSLCASYKSFTGYMCVKNKSEDLVLAACKFQSFCYLSDLILSSLNVLSESFSRVCTSFIRFNCFMCVKNKLKQVWASCIYILVIL